MMNKEDALENILWSIAYNREDSYMIDLCEELLKRINTEWCEHTDDGDIVYGFLTICFGEYGTSPRSGWFEDKKFNTAFIETLTRFKGYMEDRREMRL